MKIERIITVFEKNKDGKFLSEINADAVTLELLKKLFVPFEDDPNFYRPYPIEDKQYSELKNIINQITTYPYEEYDLFIEAVQVN